MKLDSQLNVYFAESEQRAEKQHRTFTENSYSQSLYHRYLQLYEQNQMQTKGFQNYNQEVTQSLFKEQAYLPRYQKEEIKHFDLLYQNKALKGELQQAYAVIGNLKNQLKICKQELDEMRRINQENEIKITTKHQFILQELQALLQNKVLLDEEVEYLKSSLKNNIKPLKLDICNFKNTTTQYGLSNEFPKQVDTKTIRTQNRQKQFIKSIQAMYQTISKKAQSDLTVIWRWLKQMALSYSNFVKWKKANQKRISAACYQPLIATTLISELKLIN